MRVVSCAGLTPSTAAKLPDGPWRHCEPVLVSAVACHRLGIGIRITVSQSLMVTLENALTCLANYSLASPHTARSSVLAVAPLSPFRSRLAAQAGLPHPLYLILGSKV